MHTRGSFEAVLGAWCGANFHRRWTTWLTVRWPILLIGLFACACCLSARAAEYKAGQWVRTAAPVEMKVGQQVVGRLPQGTICKVERVEGDLLWLQVEGQRGCVASDKVQAPEPLAAGVLGFRLGPDLEPLDEPISSKIGGHFAYRAAGQKGMCVVLDGLAGPAFDEIGQGTLLFSPDGHHLAYVARRANKWFVVLDGQAGV